MKTFNQIVNIFFKIKEDDIRDDLSQKDIPDWDSMNYLLFIAELEKEFAVSFSMDEVMNSNTLGDIKKMIEKNKK